MTKKHIGKTDVPEPLGGSNKASNKQRRYFILNTKTIKELKKVLDTYQGFYPVHSAEILTVAH